MTIRVLGPNDASLYRDIRLAALAGDPSSFGSTHERESAFDDATWAARLGSFSGRPGVVFVAESEGEAVGVAGVGQPGSCPTAILWGMWVRPNSRRLGVGVALLDAAVVWADERSMTNIELTVYPHNIGAIALYESCGFVETGDRVSADEIVLTRRL